MRPATPASLHRADRHGEAQCGVATGRGFGVYRTPSCEMFFLHSQQRRPCGRQRMSEHLGVAVAQLAELRDVTPAVVGSNPTGHPQVFCQRCSINPSFVSSVEERPPVEWNVSGSNPLRGAKSISAGSQTLWPAKGSVAQWQSARLITGGAMVRSHPEPPALRSTHSPMPCSSAGEQAVDNRQVVRSIRTTATSCSIHVPVAEPGYARVLRSSCPS